jgi:hypothetical protein
MWCNNACYHRCCSLQADVITSTRGIERRSSFRSECRSLLTRDVRMNMAA